MGMKTLLRWLRHPWRSWQAWRARRILAFMARVEAEDQREYLKANGIKDPDGFLREVSESVTDGKDIVWPRLDEAGQPGYRRYGASPSEGILRDSEWLKGEEA